MALFIVALLNINAYATQSSNDGSAFVTKAEFDLLMVKFNEQMEDYQSGVNAKIDTAISKYLGNMSGTTVEVLPCIINNLSTYDRTFINNAKLVGTSTTTGNTTAARLCAFFVASASAYDARNYTKGDYGYVRLNSKAVGTGEPVWATFYDSNVNNDWKIKLTEIEKNGVTYYTPVNNSIRLFRPHFNVRFFGLVVVWGTKYKIAFPSVTGFTFQDTGRVPGARTGTTVSLAGENLTNYISRFNYISEGSTDMYILRYLPGTAYTPEQSGDSYGVVYDKRSNYDSTDMYSYTMDNSAGGGIRITYSDPATDTNTYEDKNTYTYTFKGYINKYILSKATDWVNESATKVYDEAVKKVDGLPICTCQYSGNINIPLSLKNSGGGKSIVAIRAAKWGNVGPGTSKTAQDVYYNDDASGDLNINIRQDADTPITYWLKVLPILDDATSEVSIKGDVTITKK